MPSRNADQTPPQPGDPGYGDFMKLLGRLDERTKRMDDAHCDFREEMREKFADMKSTHDQCVPREEYDGHVAGCDSAHADFVTAKEFWPVKALVFGGAGLILVAVVGALIAMVVKGGGMAGAVNVHP